QLYLQEIPIWLMEYHLYSPSDQSQPEEPGALQQPADLNSLLLDYLQLFTSDQFTYYKSTSPEDFKFRRHNESSLGMRKKNSKCNLSKLMASLFDVPSTNKHVKNVELPKNSPPQVHDY
ncbi:hypothetical protein L9F63_010650, partial [Diploptera punctata]